MKKKRKGQLLQKKAFLSLINIRNISYDELQYARLPGVFVWGDLLKGILLHSQAFADGSVGSARINLHLHSAVIPFSILYPV